MMLDMPLAELQKYQGRNPRPAEFDPFWERSLSEMRALDPGRKRPVAPASRARKK